MVLRLFRKVQEKSADSIEPSPHCDMEDPKSAAKSRLRLPNCPMPVWGLRSSNNEFAAILSNYEDEGYRQKMERTFRACLRHGQVLQGFAWHVAVLPTRLPSVP